MKSSIFTRVVWSPCVIIVCLLMGASVESASADCVVSPAGLVGWWRAEGNAKDVTGQHDGAAPFGDAYAGGEVGQAFDFDFSWRRVSIPDSPAFQLTNAMTLEGWVYLRAYGGFICFRGDNRGGLDTWTLDTYQSGFVNFQIDDESNNYSSIRAPIALNQWQHVAATWDRSTGDMKVYINGSLITQTNTSIVPIGVLDPGSDPAIGIGNHGGTFHQFPMNGLVDEFAIYDRALDAVEVQSIYAAGASGKCAPPSIDQLILGGPITNSANGHWYYILAKTNWHAAESIAQSLGGHLTTINGVAENTWIVDQFSNFGGSERALWIGLSDEVVEGDWRWNDGSTSPYRNWSPYEPNSGAGIFPEEDHALIWNPSSGFPLGSWNDAFGDQEWYGVVEVQSSTPSSTLPSGPITNSANGHVYYLLAPTNWPAAEAIAVSMGGHLATINDAAENQWVFDTFGTYGDEERTLWIGLTDQQAEGDWLWISGDPSSYRNWSPVEPNNGAGIFPEENHVIIWNPSSGFPLGSWNDSLGEQIHAAVVEVSPSLVPQIVTLVDGSTPGFYNDSLGTILDGTEPHFPIPLFAGGGDPTFYPSTEPDIAAASAVLGDWLASPPGLNSNWRRVSSVPGTWEINSETAIVYPVNGGVAGVTNLLAAIDVDNAVYVWVNGVFKFGARTPGLPSPIGQFEYTNVALGDLSPGSNYIQILREDSGIATGYQIRITGIGFTAEPVVTGTNSCVASPDGLVAWWRAEGNGLDATNSNNGTLASGATFATGKVGRAFLFDGADDHFDIPASPSIDVGASGGMTFETWVNPSSIAMQVVAEWNNGGGGVGSHLWLSVDHTVAGDGVGNIYVNLYDTTETSHGILSPAGTMTANEWQHIAVTYDKTSGDAVLYRNGVVVATNNLGTFTPQTSYDLHLGYRASSAFSGTYFGGLMDEPSLYNRALTAAEIQSIYSADSSGKCAPPPSPPSVILAGPITNAANGHAYYLLSPTNWLAAEDIAVSLGGHLATINDADENAWVFNTFGSYGGGDYILWLGMTDQAEEGNWRWVSGWRGPYSSWNWGEPNNWAGGENYLWMWSPGSGAGGSWNDGPEDYAAAAVVEIGVDLPLCTATPDGLIASWSAEGNANDGFSLNHGALINETSFATGIVGQAFSFDGVNDSVSIPQSPKLNPGNQLTIEFWMKADPTNAMNSYQGLVTSDFFGIEIANGLYPGPIGVSFFISTDGGGSYPDTATDNHTGAIVSAGEWHHVAGTYDGAKLQLYIDGQPWGVPSPVSGAISAMLANSFVSIGAEDGRTVCPDCIGQRNFNGLIDEVAIYNRALTAAEIESIHHSSVSGKCPPPTLEQLVLTGPITNAANGHRYYLTTELTWHEAEAVGQRLGGHLTTINNPDENAWVQDTFGTWGENRRELWIGLTDELFEGEWRWADGSNSTNRNWGPGQPDNYGGESGENYVHFWIPDDSGNYLGTWNDAGSWVSHYGVIEVGASEPFNPILAGPITNAANGHAYYLLAPTNWPGAEQIAVSLGGHLVTINNAAENDWIQNTFGHYAGNSYTLWIGYTDQANEGDWRWINGSNSSYNNWNWGEPNNSGENENHAWVYGPATGVGGTWNDAPSSYILAAVVELGDEPFQPGTPCVAVPAGVVSWWKAEGDANNFAGTNNGAIVGGVGFGSESIGQSFVFNGYDSYINIPSSDALKPSGPFTLEAWIKYTGDPGSYSGYCIAAKGADAENAVDWALTVSANKRLRPHINVNGGWYYFDCNTTLQEGVWYHVAMNYDGAHLQGYINGALDGSTDVSGPVQTSDDPLRIGAYAPVNGDGSKAYFSGNIDEVTLYARSLSSEELLAIYNAGNNGKCADSLLIAMPDALSAAANSLVNFNARKLLLNDYDARGFALSVSSVVSNSVWGGTVELLAGRVHYTPTPGFEGNDQFAYSITNGHGGSASSTVMVTIGNGGQVGLNITYGPVIEDGQFVVRFAGIPGLTYTIEATPYLEGGWTKLTNITAPTTNTGLGIGVFEFREPINGNESRYYRTVYPAY